MESKKLTPRENEIAGLLSAGLSNQAIAEMLGISKNTVETHAKRIRAKLNIRSRSWVVLSKRP